MQNFFHGWRRKVGCILLVMACGITGLWASSGRVADSIGFHFGGKQYEIISVYGDIWCSWTAGRESYFYWRRQTMLTSAFRTGLRQTINRHDDTWIIPYWAPVLSLSLLSAYLILWKPRKRA